MNNDEKIRDDIRQAFLHTYYQKLAWHGARLQIVEVGEYRRFFSSILPEEMKHYERLTREELQQEIPFLAMAEAVTDTILYALKRAEKPQ